MRVLIVDSEQSDAQVLRQELLRNGFNVDVAGNGLQGRALALRHAYSLVVLALDLPGLDGRALLRGLRALVKTPVVIVTSSDSLEDQVFCLQNGADDYLTKPVRPQEFLARANLRMRSGRRNQAAGTGHKLSLGDLVLDLSKKRAERAGRRLDLTRQEYELLRLMLQHQGSVVERLDLAEQIWKLPGGAQTNVVDVAVSRLRVKLDAPFADKLLHTVRGIGYVLEQR